MNEADRRSGNAKRYIIVSGDAKDPHEFAPGREILNEYDPKAGIPGRVVWSDNCGRGYSLREAKEYLYFLALDRRHMAEYNDGSFVLGLKPGWYSRPGIYHNANKRLVYGIGDCAIEYSLGATFEIVAIN